MDGLLRCLAILPALATAHTPKLDLSNNDHRWYLMGYWGRSVVPFLGDEDPRKVFGFGVAYAKPERKFRFKQIPADLVWEGYYHHSTSPGIPGITYVPPNTTEAVGILAGARYKGHRRNGVGLYFEIGWGFQYANQETSDLPSKLNSTPYLGLGASILSQNHEFLIGGRLLHISNGGTKGNNPGQDQLLLTVGYRF